ncbi:MAG TPA: DUF2845 domain-containing protein [Candidatus Binatia bacterium]
MRRASRTASKVALLCAAVVAAAVLLLFAQTAAAGMICGRTVVLPGASKREVLAKCGPPSRRQSFDGKPLRGKVKSKGGSREVWVYDLGSRQLVRYLTFDRGRLRSIDFGGYGR